MRRYLLRLVFDTGVLLSAFIARGVASDLLMHLLAAHEVFIGSFIRDEVEEKLRERLGYPEADVVAVLAFLDRMAVHVDAGPLHRPVCRDPDDDYVLAIAIAASADCLITGDKDLLVLEELDGIPIIAPRDFWAFEAGR